MSLSRLEAKPQGAQFTGTVEPEGLSTWSKFLLPESGAIIWHCVTITSAGIDEAWWRQIADSAIH